MATILPDNAPGAKATGFEPPAERSVVLDVAVVHETVAITARVHAVTVALVGVTPVPAETPLGGV